MDAKNAQKLREKDLKLQDPTLLSLFDATKQSHRSQKEDRPQNKRRPGCYGSSQ